ncbi:MAG: DNA adenine methylase [Nitrospirae bacterium]|nr:DNA adenine methylase [Nitrospirota bacterium]
MGIFRYPGGKLKLLEPIKEYLYPYLKRSNSFTEPFVGGGSVLCEVAKDFPNMKLFANDKDHSIYAFWKMLANDDDKQLKAFYDLINQKPTVELFEKMRKTGPIGYLADHAYFAVFFNRTAFSGIQTSGPIGGYEQKSKYTIYCRYNAKRIIKECEELRGLFRGRLIVTNEDCVSYVLKASGPMYLDPPYYVKGKELYPVFMRNQEHADLADVLRSKRDWVLSYDICPEISEIYRWADTTTLDALYSIRDKKTKWTPKKEYIILPPGDLKKHEGRIA